MVEWLRRLAQDQRIQVSQSYLPDYLISTVTVMFTREARLV
jgi:hypothetical protein